MMGFKEEEGITMKKKTCLENKGEVLWLGGGGRRDKSRRCMEETQVSVNLSGKLDLV